MGFIAIVSLVGIIVGVIVWREIVSPSGSTSDEPKSIYKANLGANGQPVSATATLLPLQLKSRRKRHPLPQAAAQIPGADHHSQLTRSYKTLSRGMLDVRLHTISVLLRCASVTLVEPSLPLRQQNKHRLPRSMISALALAWRRHSAPLAARLGSTA